MKKILLACVLAIGFVALPMLAISDESEQIQPLLKQWNGKCKKTEGSRNWGDFSAKLKIFQKGDSLRVFWEKGLFVGGGGNSSRAAREPEHKGEHHAEFFSKDGAPGIRFRTGEVNLQFILENDKLIGSKVNASQNNWDCVLTCP